MTEAQLSESHQIDFADNLTAQRVELVAGDAVEDPFARHTDHLKPLVVDISFVLISSRVSLHHQQRKTSLFAQLCRSIDSLRSAQFQQLPQLLDSDVGEGFDAAEFEMAEEQFLAQTRPEGTVFAVHVQHFERFFVDEVLVFEALLDPVDGDDPFAGGDAVQELEGAFGAFVLVDADDDVRYARFVAA